MATITTEAPTELALSPWRCTAVAFHQMAAAGVFEDDARLELMDGVIYQMSPVGNPHGNSVDYFTETLGQLLGRRTRIRIQGALRLDAETELYPDVQVLVRRPGHYATITPGPADVHWLIEVCDTTLRTDRAVKLPLYARAGVAEVWLVDLNGERVEIYREPTATGYASVTTVARGGQVQPAAFPEVVLAVDAILTGE